MFYRQSTRTYPFYGGVHMSTRTLHRCAREQ